MRLVIVDYGMGNLRSVEKAFAKLGLQAEVTSSEDRLREASALVVPGVGAFGDAMTELERLGLVAAIQEKARQGTPILGICLGLQIFFEESEEAPGARGLGLLPGRVERFSPTIGLKIPHMGWNSLEIRPGSRLFAGVSQGAFVYFVHSYFVRPSDPNVTAAWADYGTRFTAAIETGVLFGVQFHPEKSQQVGLRILENFACIARKESGATTPKG